MEQELTTRTYMVLSANHAGGRQIEDSEESKTAINNSDNDIRHYSNEDDMRRFEASIIGLSA